MVPSSLTTSHSTPAGAKPGEAREVDGGLRVAGALEHAAALARSGKTWPGRRRSSGSVAVAISTAIVRARSAAETPVVVPCRASTVSVNAVPMASLPSSLISGSSRRSRRSRSMRDADDARAVAHHEGERLGRRRLGGADEVALVLAVLVVDDDDHLAAADRLDRLFCGDTHAGLLNKGRTPSATQ